VFVIFLILSLNNHDCFLNKVGSDLSYTISSPSRWKRNDYIKLSGITASLGALIFLDGDIRDEVQDYNGTINNLVDPFEQIGSEIGIAILGSSVLIGYVTDNDRIKHLSLGASESVFISVGITYLIKMAMGRKRPRLEAGPYKWTGPTLESERMSMPSGHSTFAFAIASYISSETDNLLIDILSYACATLVGYSRIKDDQHWTSDVYLGAIIGISVGRTISILD
jgi:hypothetical protein